MYFPISLNDSAKTNKENKLPKPIVLNEEKTNFHFSRSLRCLGSIMLNDLTDDIDVETRIKNKA